MSNADRRGFLLTLLLGAALLAPMPSMATASRPIAYRLLSEARQGDALRSIARTVAATELAPSPPARTFEELGRGVAWLPRIPGGACVEVTSQVRIDDPLAGAIVLNAQARCIAPLLRDHAPCGRYRIAIQGSAQAVFALDDGGGGAAAPEWREVLIRGEGEMISCVGEPAARACSLGIERQVVPQPWAETAGAPSEAQRIDIAWAALP